MNKFNVKLGSTFAIVAVLASVILPTATPAFGAMNNPEFDDALAWGYENGLTSYNTEQAFMPYGLLTRAQGSKFLSQFADSVLGLEADPEASCEFSDITTADQSLVPYIAQACGQGILKGSAGKFMPNASMTKAQFITALVRSLNGGELMDESTTPWYKNYCTWAQENGITKEDNCAALDRPVTRYEALLMLYRGSMDQGEITTPVDPSDESTDPEVIPAGNGEYTVSTSAESPKGVTLPGLAPAHVASFDVEADSDGKLSSITLERLGLGNKDSIKNVTLYINGDIASKTRAFESDGTREFVLTPTLTLKAGEVVTIDVIATIGDKAVASNQEFTIAAIEVNGKSIDPVKANKFRVGAVNATSVELNVDVNTDTVKLGEKGVELASFDLKNNDDDYNVMIDAITLKDSENNIRTNFKNFVLEFDGDEVATVESVNGKYLTFKFAKPLVIGDGQRQDFKVKADPIAGIGKKTKLIIDDVNYIMGRDDKYGYGLAVILDNPTNNGTTVTIDGGDVTLEEINLDIDEIREDRKDYLLAAFDLTVNAGSDIELDKLVFTANTAAGYANPRDIFSKVKVSVGGDTEEVDTIDSTLTFDDLALSIPTGKKVRVEVRGDTKSNLSGYVGKYVQLNIAAAGISLEDLDESEDITDITPSSLSFDRLMISEPGVAISKISSRNLDVVAGQTKIPFLDFQIETDDISSAKFRKFTLNGTTDFNRTNVTNVTLVSVGSDGRETAIKSWSSSRIAGNKLDLDGLSVVIPASSTQRFRVNIDVTSNNNIIATGIQATATAFEVRDDENDIIPNTASFTTARIAIVGAGQLNVSNSTSVIKNNSYIVAGSTSKNVAEFKIRATKEDIKLKDVAVTFTNAAQFVDAVSKVELVKADGTLLNPGNEGTVSTSDTSSVAINDLNYVIKKDSEETLYVRLVTKTMGDAGQATVYGTDDFTLGLQIVDAEGVTSNTDLTVPAITSPYTVAIVPVRISAVALTDYDTSTLSAGMRLGKLTVTADAWNNSKQANSSSAKLLIKTIKLACSMNGFTANPTLALKGDSGELATGVCDGTSVTFTLPASDDADLNANETATYYIDLKTSSFTSPASLRIDFRDTASISFSESDSATVYNGLRFATVSPDLGSAFADVK